MPEPKQYSVVFSTSTYADDISDAVSVAQLQFDSGDVYVEVFEEGVIPSIAEFDNLTDALAHTAREKAAAETSDLQDRLKALREKAPPALADLMERMMGAGIGKSEFAFDTNDSGAIPAPFDHDAFSAAIDAEMEASVTPKSDCVEAFVKRHEYLHKVFVADEPRDATGFLKPRVCTFTDEWSQPSAKIKRKLGKLTFKKWERKQRKKGKRK